MRLTTVVAATLCGSWMERMSLRGVRRVSARKESGIGGNDVSEKRGMEGRLEV